MVSDKWVIISDLMEQLEHSSKYTIAKIKKEGKKLFFIMNLGAGSILIGSTMDESNLFKFNKNLITRFIHENKN
jgi:hypothetical protein